MSTLAHVIASGLRHQAITWTDVDLSSVRSRDIYPRVISHKMLSIFILDTSLKITNLRSQLHLPGANKLNSTIQLKDNVHSTHLMFWFGLILINFLSFGITMASQWAQWCLNSSASWLLTQTFIQAQIKENIKALHHWPFCREFTGDQWIPAQMASNAENASHLITSSWDYFIGTRAIMWLSWCW